MIGRLEQLLADATPEPWRVCPNWKYIVGGTLYDCPVVAKVQAESEGVTLPGEQNAALIVELRNVAPALLAAIKAAKRVDEEWRSGNVVGNEPGEIAIRQLSRTIAALAALSTKEEGT